MTPSAALLGWLILLIALLRFDPAREPETSPALWVPIIWLFIAGSRLPSQWLGINPRVNALEEGNSVDRTVYTTLIVLAIGILLSRSFRWAEFFSQNIALTAFVSFALVSVLWSDYPLIAFKRWIRDLGDYFVVLVVLSDRRPADAVRTVLRRVCYLLIPLSVVFVKYFPALGIHYSVWTGAPEFAGVTTSKNTLGGICLLSGLVFFWDTAMRWSNRKRPREKRIILVNLALLTMTLWLLDLSSSATAQVCLVLGCLVILATHSEALRRHPGFLQTLIPAGYILYLIVTFGLGLTGELASAVGRDPTLTGRTVIWKAVLSTGTNPLLGTGYESFWLGPRLAHVWTQTGPGINETHNSYLDIYVNLGLIGLFILICILIVSFKKICRELKRVSNLGSFGAAVWAVTVFAGTTEVVMKNGLPWMVFLLGTLVPQWGPRRQRLSGTGYGMKAAIVYPGSRASVR
jgi:exopolysaccharide production protein ExoQ